MKTLFIGGIKSGKSRLAESYALELAQSKPYYLATTEFIDDEMRQRIAVHQQRRQENFITVEEPVQLAAALQHCSGLVLIECVSMWLNNMLFHNFGEDVIFQQLETIVQLPIDLVFVLNEVGFGIIPDNPLARQYVDLSGKTAQFLAANCDAVYLCSAGLKMKMK